MLLAVNADAVATPLVLVVAVVVIVPLANVPLAPVFGAVNVTTTPLSGSELLSFTVAENAVAKGMLICADWFDPAVTVMDAGVPARFVRLKSPGVEIPVTVAVTVYGPPAVSSAVNKDAAAMPLALVVAVVVFVPLAKVPLGALLGAVKVTVVPLTGLLLLSVTVTCSVANAVFTGTL